VLPDETAWYTRFGESVPAAGDGGDGEGFNPSGGMLRQDDLPNSVGTAMRQATSELLFNYDNSHSYYVQLITFASALIASIVSMAYW
jgi:hypothetical protein